MESNLCNFFGKMENNAILKWYQLKYKRKDQWFQETEVYY